MAGSLIKIDEEIVTSAVASVTLGGSDWDSSYDVYMVKMNNAQTVSDTAFFARFTESGTPNSLTSYDWAYKYFKADTSFANYNNSNQNYIPLTTTNESSLGNANGVFYIFNANNSGEYTFLTGEETHIQGGTTTVRGIQGGATFKQASSVDGINIFANSGNIASGQFVLYGLKK